jgi:putative hydrolase
VAHGLNAERLRRQLDVVAELNEELAPFRILTGIEVDILEDGSLDQDEDSAGRARRGGGQRPLQAAHGVAGHDRRMLRAVESPHTDILGHCTGRIVVAKGRPQSTFDAEAVFGACARTGTAVEINSRPERQDPPEDLLRLALSLGCVVAVDTDAHAPGQLEWQRNGWAGGQGRRPRGRVMPPDRIVNRLDRHGG